MKMIVGLGNPGKKYELSKHNIGFLAADLLADYFEVDITQNKENAFIAEARLETEKILLVKPQTYMNLSGRAVAALARYFKIAPQEILVIYDDLDLEKGITRVRAKGTAGGHNGIKSIIEHLGTTEFPRIKVGIGRPYPGWQTPDYVLSPFNDEEWKLIEPALMQVKEVAIEVIKNGVIAAMNKYNGKGVNK